MCGVRIVRRFDFICSRVELDQVESDETFLCRDTFTLPVSRSFRPCASIGSLRYPSTSRRYVQYKVDVLSVQCALLLDEEPY